MTGIIRRKYESQGASITGLNQKSTFSYTMPAGYSRVAGVFFNPALDFLLTLRSQRAQDNLLTNFSTIVGNYGFVPLYNEGLETDVLNLSWEYLSGGVVPPGFPFINTFTLAYE